MEIEMGSWTELFQKDRERKKEVDALFNSGTDLSKALDKTFPKLTLEEVLVNVTFEDNDFRDNELTVELDKTQPANLAAPESTFYVKANKHYQIHGYRNRKTKELIFSKQELTNPNLQKVVYKTQEQAQTGLRDNKLAKYREHILPKLPEFSRDAARFSSEYIGLVDAYIHALTLDESHSNYHKIQPRNHMAWMKQLADKIKEVHNQVSRVRYADKHHDNLHILTTKLIKHL